LVLGGFKRERGVQGAEGAAVVRQPGGQLVVAGTLVRWEPPELHRMVRAGVVLVRLTSRGRVDPTFGTGGRVITNLSGGYSTSLMRQPDGRLVVAGGARGRMVVLRYTPSGRLDRSFGHDGAVVVSPGPGTDVATGVRPMAGGRILVVGQSGRLAALVRLCATGRFDTAFGRGGKVVLSLGPRASRFNGVAIDRRGRILTAGTTGATAVVARFSARGALDRTFGMRGLAAVPEATGHALAVDVQGRTLLAGGNLGPGYGLMVARFSDKGRPDPGFGRAGISRIAGRDANGHAAAASANALALDRFGRLLVAGGGGNVAFLGRLSTRGDLPPRRDRAERARGIELVRIPGVRGERAGARRWSLRVQGAAHPARPADRRRRHHGR
jgi:uncharacterized delta-60 repeat protein